MTRIHKPGIFHLFKDIFLALARYARGQVLIALIMSSLYAVGFFFAKVPFWWLAGILCGPFHLLPVVGTPIAAIIPVSFQLIGGGGFWDVLWVLLVIAAVQLLESFYLTPKILGRELRLHPVVIILLVLCGAILAGPVGALIAAPIGAIGLMIWRRLAIKKQKLPS
jgi:predicted PurR-regulated permease PerM